MNRTPSPIIDQTLPANAESNISSATFRYDIKAPTATIVVPSGNVLNTGETVATTTTGALPKTTLAAAVASGANTPSPTRSTHCPVWRQTRTGCWSTMRRVRA